MQEQTASKTALATAYMRAAHQVLDQPPFLFEDPVAMAILGPKAHSVIQEHLPRHQSASGAALRTHVCLRARHAEDRLAQAVTDGLDAYVLVGAGYDTFALRRPGWAQGLLVVEVDHPATQAAKRSRLAQAGFPEPPDTLFVSADLSRESLGDALARYGLGRDKRLFFSWLGVTMYLEIPAIQATLRDMASFAPGSQAVVTYREHAGAQADTAGKTGTLADRVAQVGEAFVTCLNMTEMDALLESCGFDHREFLTPEQAEKRYFTPPRPDLPAPRGTSIVWATTKS